MSTLINYEEFPQIILEFVNYKIAIQNCSIKTVEEYMLDLRTFFRYLLAVDNHIDVQSDEFANIDIRQIDLDYVKKVTSTKIYDFLMYAGNTRGNMWSARSRKLSAIKAFYKFVVNKRNWMTENPTANIESPKPKKSLPKFLSIEECQLLLDAIQNDQLSKTTKRDWCMITLFLNCGMRLSELVGINLNDLDRELRSVRVLGKGNKERILYFNESCQVALADYLTERLAPKNENIQTKALFLSTHGRDQRISVKTVQYIVNKYLTMAGLEAKHYSVHKLRHTAATLMYQSGNVDIRVLKDILGHEQLNTTQIYTHVSNEGMEQAMNQNPLAGIKRTKHQESSADSEED